MILRRLTDTTLTEADTSSASGAQRVGNMPAAGQNWDDAYKSAYMPADKQAVVDEFLADYERRKGVTLGESERKMLSKWVGELGFRTQTNPFLDYVAIAKRNTSLELDEYLLIILNNAYAERSITAQDLRGQGQDRELHLIFQRYWLSSNDEREYMLDSYVWLSKPSNIKTLDLAEIKSIANLQSPNTFPASYKNLIAGGSGNQSSYATENRNILVYQDCSGSVKNNSMRIQPSNTLEVVFTYDAKNVKRRSADRANIKELKKAYDTLSDVEKDAFDQMLDSERY